MKRYRVVRLSEPHPHLPQWYDVLSRHSTYDLATAALRRRARAEGPDRLRLIEVNVFGEVLYFATIAEVMGAPRAILRATGAADE